MKCRALITMLLLSLAATSASAQTWTPEQQEVIDHEKTCWDLWQAEDLVAYRTHCTADPLARFWWMPESVPDFGPKEWIDWAETMFSRVQAIHSTHRPISVEFYGDVAIYYFWANYGTVDDDGEVTFTEQHRLSVYERRGEAWVHIAGAGAPAPGSK